MTDPRDFMPAAELAFPTLTTDRGTFRMLPSAEFRRLREAQYDRAVQQGLVRPPPLPVRKPESYSLAAWQTEFRHQGNRGTCFAFAVAAAMEARYRRNFGRVLRMSEHYIAHRVKYSELYGDYATSQVAWENNSSFWGGQGSGAIVFWMQRFGVPDNTSCPYLLQENLEALRQANPSTGLLDGKPGMTQEQIDTFELLDGMVPRAGRVAARYRIRQAAALPINAAVEHIEACLLADCEVIVDIDWDLQWNEAKQAYDYGGKAAGHCVLIVGYDSKARVFLVKNSHGEGRLLRLTYEYFTKQTATYHYITEVSHPDAPPDEAAPWIDEHPTNLGGAKGRLVIRRTTNFRVDDPTAPTKLGDLYREGESFGRDVNGVPVDGGRGLIFHVSAGAARVAPGTPSGTLYAAGEQGSWRWCCKCQSLFYAGNTAATACPASGAHDPSGSGWYALPFTASRLGGQGGWAWCRKCQTLHFAGNGGGRCPLDGKTHDAGGSSDYFVGWESAPRTFAGQTAWRWCNKCDALFFAGGGATRCAKGGAHDAGGSGAYVLRHEGPLAWQRYPGALSQVSIGADGMVVGVTAQGGIFRIYKQDWEQLPGALVQVSVGAFDQTWGVNAAQQIFKFNGNTWDRVDGALTCVAAAADGAVWGVNAAQQIFRRDGAVWTLIPGALKQISVASASLVFGVASNGQVFRRVGDGWDRIGGYLRQVSVATDGSVWGVNPSDEIFRWNGGDWDRINGALKYVSQRARDRVWGVSANDEVWRVDT